MYQDSKSFNVAAMQGEDMSAVVEPEVPNDFVVDYHRNELQTFYDAEANWRAKYPIEAAEYDARVEAQS